MDHGVDHGVDCTCRGSEYKLHTNIRDIDFFSLLVVVKGRKVKTWQGFGIHSHPRKFRFKHLLLMQRLINNFPY